MNGGVMSTGIVICVVLLASFCGSDGMRISQQTVTTYDDSKDDVSENGLPQLLKFFNAVDDTLTPRDANELIDELDADTSLDDGYTLEKGCSKGKCTICKKVKIIKICVVAEVLTKGFSIAVTVNGKQIAKKEVTIPSPPPICIEKIPGIKAISHLCVTATKINLKEKSGCLNASFKMKVGPVHKTIKVSFGCFKIPIADDVTDVGDVMDEEEELTVDAVSQLLQTLFTTGDVDNNGVMAVTTEDSDISTEQLFSAFVDVQEIDMAEFLKGCHKGRCHFCKKVVKLNFCVDAGVMSKGLGIDITVTVNGHRIYHNEISATNPPPICFNHIPGLSHVTNLCLKFYDIDLKQKHACLKVTFKILIKKFSVKIGCFHIPVDEIEMINEEEASVDGIADINDVTENTHVDDPRKVAAGMVTDTTDTDLRFETNASG